MRPPVFNPFPELHSQRLLLRQLSPDDASLVLNYRSDKSHFPHVDMPEFDAMQDALEYINRMNRGVFDNKWIVWAIAEPTTEKILGTISLWNIDMEQEKAELGFGLFPGNHGKGIMTEALRQVIGYGFDVLQLRYIEAWTSMDNTPSQRLLRRCGFGHIQTKTDTDTHSGRPQEMAAYRLACDDQR